MLGVKRCSILLSVRASGGATVTDIKALRTRLALSQQGLAARLGVALQTVWRWEHGTKPLPAHQEKLDRIAKEGRLQE